VGRKYLKNKESDQLPKTSWSLRH